MACCGASLPDGWRLLLFLRRSDFLPEGFG